MHKSRWISGIVMVALITGGVTVWRVTHANHPKLQHVDKSPESVKQYHEIRWKARQAGYLKSSAGPASSTGFRSIAIVSSGFMALDYEDKEELLKNIYSIYFDGTREADRVDVIDSLNNTMIGEYRPYNGLLMNLNRPPEWSRSDIIALCQAIIAGLGMIVIAVGLLFNFRELHSAAQSLEETKRSLRMSTHIATADAVNEINMLIASNDDIRKVASESHAETLVHVRLNRFEQMFLLFKERLLDADAMKGVEAWIGDSMKKPEMREYWPMSRKYFSATFGEWIDRLADRGSSGQANKSNNDLPMPPA